MSPRLVAVLHRVSKALADAAVGEDGLSGLVTRAVATALEGSCVLWRREPAGASFGLAACFDPDPERLGMLLEALADSHPSATAGVLPAALAAPGPTELVPVDWQELGGWSTSGAVRLAEAMGDSSLTLRNLSSAHGELAGTDRCRQRRLAHESRVYSGRGRTSLCDGPDDEALAPRHVATGIHPFPTRAK